MHTATALNESVILVDLAEEVAQFPSLSLLDLCQCAEFSGQDATLTVSARDVLAASNRRDPSIMILGQPLDIVQLVDFGLASRGGTWLFEPSQEYAPGFVTYVFRYQGNQLRLSIQDGIEIYDADGVKL